MLILFGDKIRSQTKPFLYLFQLVAAKDPVHEERQRPDGTVVPKPEVRVAPGNGIYKPAGSKAGYQLLPDELLQLAASTSTQ